MTQRAAHRCCSLGQVVWLLERKMKTSTPNRAAAAICDSAADKLLGLQPVSHEVAESLLDDVLTALAELREVYAKLAKEAGEPE